MNRYCDWVEIMAYDQQRADILLNDQRRGVPYAPVADTEWVEHVLEFALEDFDEDKVMLGVATYGRAWDVTVAPEWYRDYERVATLNEPRIMELVEKYDVEIGRTEAGEAVITYFPEDSPWRVFDALPAPAGTPKGFEAAAKALLVATYADIEIPVRFLTWSDTKAVEEKLELVDEYDLRGTAIFKIDGEEPEGLWELF
jgi:spore germination protein YaaH